MSNSNPALEALKALVQSDAFAAVKASSDALDPAVLLEPGVGAHLKAFQVGMAALAAAPALQPEPEGEGEGE